MKKIFNLIVFTMVAALTLSTNSFAMDATQKKASLIQMVEKLNLSADQKKQLSQIKSQQTTEYTATFAKVKMINKQLHALSKDKVMDEKKLDILINQKKELLGAIMKRYSNFESRTTCSITSYDEASAWAAQLIQDIQ